MTQKMTSPIATWVVLMLLSGLSLFVAEEVSPQKIAVVAIFAVAMVKVYMVMVHFMEVNEAAPHWRALYHLWILVAGSMLALGNAM